MMNEQNDNQESQRRYDKKYGGVAFPGKLPGFAVVVGMEQEKLSIPSEHRHVYVLDEFESEDLRHLLRQCRALGFKHGPERWIGNSRHDAAQRFICEMNAESKDSAQPYAKYKQKFNLTATCILDMEHPFPYILPELKRMLGPNEKQLFFGQSKIAEYLTAIQAEEIPDLEFGEFPAIEALGFAVIEMIRAAKYESDRLARPRHRPAYGRRHVFDNLKRRR